MADLHRNLDSVFMEALAFPSAEQRDAYLEEACVGNPELREEVDRMLAAHKEAGGFLEQPPAQLADALDAGLAPAFADGEVVVIGRAGHSVFKNLGATVNLSRVVLREPKAEGPEPIQRPTSSELPVQHDDRRYQLQGEIARGGMGAILKGRDTDLGRDLAIKVLLDEHKTKPQVIQRFVEEAQIGGQLQHPGIVPVYELGQFADERPFFSMKLVKGETLSKLLAEREQPTDDRAKLLGIFEQVCQTMAYAHSRGVIHRDLKPANIMVGAFGEVQVMDWGLAKVLSAGGVADEKKARDTHMGTSIIQTLRSIGSDTPGTFGAVGSHTQMGSVMGTPAYMPPEQALGEIDHLDERADVFALGAILCEILTGKPAYVADDGTQVYRMASRGKLNECFERLDACGADEDLIALTKQCLELEPADRPRHAGVLAGRVTRYLESVESKLHETEMQRAAEAARVVEERKRRRVQLALAATVLLSLGIGAAAWRSIEIEAMERREAATSKINSALNAALVHQNQANVGELGDQLAAIDKAVLSAKQAAELAEQEDMDPAIRTRANQLFSELTSSANSLQSLAEQTRKNQAFLEELDLIRLSQAGGNVSDISAAENLNPRARQQLGTDGEPLAQAEQSELDESTHPGNPLKQYRSFDMGSAAKLYEQAFRRSGFDFASLTTTQAAKLIRASAIRESLLSALDNWARVLPEAVAEGATPSADRGATGITRERLLEIASAADPSDWRKQLRTALAAGKTERLKELSVKDDISGQSPSLIAWLGAALREAELLEDSVRVLLKAQQQHPGDFWLNYELGRSLVEQGGTAEGLGYARAAVALRPQSAGALIGLCANLARVRRYEEAEVVARRALELDPSSAVAVTNIGQALYGRGKHDLAASEFRKAIDLDPTYIPPRQVIADILKNDNKWGEAEEVYRKAVEIEPLNADLHIGLSFSQYKQGKYVDAVSAGRKAVELKPRSLGARNVLAIALGDNGQFAEAELEYRLAIEIDPENPVVRTNFAIYLQINGRQDEAIEQLQKALEVNPSYARTRSLLRDALRDRGLQRAASGKRFTSLTDFNEWFRLAENRDQKTRVLARLQLFPDLLKRFAEARPDNRQVQLALLATPGDESDEFQLSNARAQMLLDCEQEQLAHPKDKNAAFDLADMLLQPEVTQWQILDPVDMQGAGGTTLTRLPDGSIMAGRRLGAQLDPYRFVAKPQLESITAIRLELIPDTSLPNCGPGRGDHFPNFGNTQLKEIRLFMRDVNGEETPIDLIDAVASYAPENRKVGRAIDGDEWTQWNVWDRWGEWNAGVFRLETPLSIKESQELVVTLQDYIGTSLGRFRLSVTSDVNAFQRESVRFAAMRETDAWKRLASAYQLQGNDIGLNRLIVDHPEKALELAKLNAEYGRWNQAIAAYSRLIEDSPEDVTLLTARAAGYLATGQLELAHDDLKHVFNVGPNEAAAKLLAEVLLAQSSENWTVLEPTEMESAGRATLTRLADGSILASGTNTTGDAYTIVAEADPMQVTAIRLEALPDDSLPNRGPGRDPERDLGNFDMANWEVSLQTPGGEEVPVSLRQAVANPPTRIPITPTTWNISGGVSQPLTATYLLQEPVDFRQGVRTKFRMQFSDNEDWPQQNLGRFRLSVSADPNAFPFAKARIAAKQESDPWKKLAWAYYLAGDTPALNKLLQDHPEVGDAIGELQLLAGQYQQAIAFYDSRITPETEDADLLAKRAAAHARLGQSDLAKADWLRAAELQSDLLDTEFQRFQQAQMWPIAAQLGQLLLDQQAENSKQMEGGDVTCLQVAAVLVLAGDQAAYSDFCRWMVQTYDGSEHPLTVQRVCHACLLTPEGGDALKLPLGTLAKSVENGWDPSDWFPPWIWSTRALAAYRTGDAAHAVEYAEHSDRFETKVELGHAMNLATIAMAQQDLGKHDEAVRALEELSQIVSRHSWYESENNQDQLIARILLREAEAKVHGGVEP